MASFPFNEAIEKIMIKLTSDLNANYQRFIEHSQETGRVWGLHSADGWVIVDSAEFEDSEVIPFWSEENYASAHCVGEWEKFKPTPIELEDFVENWLVGMDEDGTLVGPNWNADLEGLEIEPVEIAKQLGGTPE